MAARGRMLFISGSTEEPANDIRQHFDELLASVGIDKSKLLTAGVALSDMALLPELNAAWEQWVDPSHRPLRVCRVAVLEQPGSLVRIEVTATK
jgi:enamine deaminase RidA (YjgF/YER057c/UK114 family)